MPESSQREPQAPASDVARTPNASSTSTTPKPDQVTPVSANATAASTPVYHAAEKAAAVPNARSAQATTLKPLAPRHVEMAPSLGAQVPRPDPIAGKVSALLSKADSYIANRQYDKAIATAESVLELDPSSAGAKAAINLAKSRQTELLRSGSALE
jgi:hypothetical protein